MSSFASKSVIFMDILIKYSAIHLLRVCYALVYFHQAAVFTIFPSRKVRRRLLVTHLHRLSGNWFEYFPIWRNPPKKQPKMVYNGPVDNLFMSLTFFCLVSAGDEVPLSHVYSGPGLPTPTGVGGGAFPRRKQQPDLKF